MPISQNYPLKKNYQRNWTWIAFKNDLENNLHFESNIPQGYGVGSSGAICAAVYDAYAIDKITEPKTFVCPN